jgi:hypothetical protein
MSKSTVCQLFIGATLTFVIGAIVLVAAGVAAIANGVIGLGGPTIVTIDGSAFGGVAPWLLLAGLLMGVGSVVAVASWVGALANTIRLDDKTWFVGLLVLGLVSFGWIAMVAYVVAGPDGTAPADATGQVASAAVR